MDKLSDRGGGVKELIIAYNVDLKYEPLQIHFFFLSVDNCYNLFMFTPFVILKSNKKICIYCTFVCNAHVCTYFIVFLVHKVPRTLAMNQKKSFFYNYNFDASMRIKNFKKMFY